MAEAPRRQKVKTKTSKSESTRHWEQQHLPIAASTSMHSVRFHWRFYRHPNLTLLVRGLPRLPRHIRPKPSNVTENPAIMFPLTSSGCPPHLDAFCEAGAGREGPLAIQVHPSRLSTHIRACGQRKHNDPDVQRADHACGPILNPSAGTDSHTGFSMERPPRPEWGLFSLLK
jgi:hypothetical protein